MEELIWYKLWCLRLFLAFFFFWFLIRKKNVIFYMNISKSMCNKASRLSDDGLIFKNWKFYSIVRKYSD